MKKKEYLNYYVCSSLIEPKITAGYVSLANKDDIAILAEYWYYAHLEMEYVTPITKKESTEYVEKLFNKAKIYKCTENNEIVSIGYYEITNKKAKISGIYTIPSKRRNGYATNLVSTMTKDILNDNYISTLYAAKKYIPSNNLYIKLGYQIKKES